MVARGAGTGHLEGVNRRFLLRAGALAAVVGGAWWARENLLWPDPQVSFDDGEASPWAPYARRAGVPTIDVSVGGTAVVALIDTGAQYSVIDRRLTDRLPPQERSMFEMPLVAYGVGGNGQMGRGTTLTLGLPGLRVEGLRAAILDLGPLATPQGLGTPLILGRDVLRQVVLALDTDRRHARLISRGAFHPAADMVEAETARAGDALAADVSVEGAVIRAIVDTGSSSLLALDRNAAGAAGLLDGRPAEAGSSLVLGGSLSAEIVTARTVTFADQLYRQVQVGVFDQPPLPNFPGALLGMAAFEGRRLALDLERNRMFVSRALDLTIGQAPEKVSQAAGSPLS